MAAVGRQAGKNALVAPQPPQFYIISKSVTHDYYIIRKAHRESDIWPIKK